MPGTKNGRRSLNSILGFPSDKDVDFLLVHLLICPSMKLFVLFLAIFLFANIQANAAETWTLTDKKGRSIEVDYIFYDGVNLMFRRVGSVSKVKVSPDLLEKSSWAKIQDEFGSRPGVRLEVERTTKTSTDKNRSVYSGYYHYSHERKETQKLNRFSVEVTSSSHFESELRLEYFIFAEGEVEYDQIPFDISLRAPFETVLEKMMESTEYTAKSTYSGTYYKSESGDDKATIGIIILNSNDEELAEYSSSRKIAERMHSLKHNKRSNFRPKKKKGKKEKEEPPVHEDVFR